MKKSLLALAVLGAFAGAASAQTSITIYGSFDGGIRSLSNVPTGVGTETGNRLTLGSGGTYNQNRLGFKGVEDLGGGMNAHFNLEMGWNGGTGAGDAAGLFQRTASVGLGGAWGSVDLGRQYSVNFKTIGLYDPFVYKYTGIVPLATQGGLTRLNNNIQYSGKFGGVGLMAEYALGEVAGSTSSNSTMAIGANYAAAGFTVGGAYTQGKRGAADNDMKNWTVGGAYMTGPFRVAVGYADNKISNGLGAGLESRAKDWWVGGHMYVTPAAAISVGYYETKGTAALNPAAGGNDGKRKLFIVGATYALSKRTNFYADIDNARFNNAANSPSQTGFSVGINHLF